MSTQFFFDMWDKDTQIMMIRLSTVMMMMMTILIILQTKKGETMICSIESSMHENDDASMTIGEDDDNDNDNHDDDVRQRK